MDKLKACVMGSTGVVGREFCRRLSNHPFFDLTGVYASGTHHGTSLARVFEDDSLPNLPVNRADVEQISAGKYDLVFSAVSETHAAELEIQLASRGMKVFSNASGNRMNKNVPIMIPEINPDHLKVASGEKGFIIANGNCSTIGLALSLAPLIKHDPENVDVVTMQSVSGAGYPGTPSLDVISNIYPDIPNEETKLSVETSKIFGGVSDGEIIPHEVSINAICTRVPVREGHMISVFLKFGKEFERQKAVDAFLSYGNGKLNGRGLPSLPTKTVIYHETPARPQPALDLYAGGSSLKSGMAVSVGHLESRGNILSYVTLVHNLVRGASGASILNAEYLFQEGLL